MMHKIFIAIAHQCPHTGGRAVLAARSLYRTKIAKHFDDDVLCLPSGLRHETALQQGPSSHLSVRPNPASNQISLIFQSATAGTYRVQISDLAGRMGGYPKRRHTRPQPFCGKNRPVRLPGVNCRPPVRARKTFHHSLTLHARLQHKSYCNRA